MEAPNKWVHGNWVKEVIVQLSQTWKNNVLGALRVTKEGSGTGELQVPISCMP